MQVVGPGEWETMAYVAEASRDAPVILTSGGGGRQALESLPCLLFKPFFWAVRK